MVGVPPDVTLDGPQLFFSQVRIQGGPATVRRFLPTVLDLITRGEIESGRVFDRTLPLARAADGDTAMDERRAVAIRLC